MKKLMTLALGTAILASSAFADCNEAYKSVLSKHSVLNSAHQTQHALSTADAALVGGVTTAFVLLPSGPEGVALGVAVSFMGGAIAAKGLQVTTIDKMNASTKASLEKASKLLNDAEAGDGQTLRELQNELNEDGLNIELSDLADEVNILNKKEVICPADGVFTFDGIKRILN